MARIVKEEAYAARRNQILDAAQRYIYTKGYEQMSIQDILDELKISKGAFYHYFNSKQALLDGLIDRLWEEMQNTLKPVLENPDMPALIKLQKYFDTAIQWKTAKKDFMLALLRIWYADENALVRQRQQIAMQKRLAPLIAGIIQQGVREGSFSTIHPDQTAEIVINVLVGLGFAWADILLLSLPANDTMQQVEALVKAYTVAMERILGAASGSISFIDEKTIQAWAIPSGNTEKDMSVVQASQRI
jgi:AcrR family transcriptional regulator